MIADPTGTVLRGVQVLGRADDRNLTAVWRAHWRCKCLTCGRRFTCHGSSLRRQIATPLCPECIRCLRSEHGRKGGKAGHPCGICGERGHYRQTCRIREAQ